MKSSFDNDKENKTFHLDVQLEPTDNLSIEIQQRPDGKKVLYIHSNGISLCRFSNVSNSFNILSN